MNKLEKIFLGFAIILTIFALVIVGYKNPQHSAGSVGVGNSYHSTTTITSLGVAMATNHLLQTGTGDLGSVVITGANTGVINIYDSTTTGSHSDYPTTLLASFPASIVAGTYTFDTQFYHGLVVEITGTVATSTITFRGN